MKNNFTRQVSLISFLFIILLSLGWPSTAFSEIDKAGGTFRIPLSNDPGTLDPAHITGIYAVNVAMNIFDGLVEFDKELNLVPAIARRWIISRNHRSYTFFLKKGIKFHNGREVVAQDFVYSLNRILDPKTKSPVASFFSYISGAKEFSQGKTSSATGISALDSHTLKIDLEEPFAPFLSILATANAKVIPKEAVGPDFGKKPVGTGPFKFDKWESGKILALSANQNYFAGRPYLDALNFVIYPGMQWEIIFGDFEKGLLDQATVPKQQYEKIKANPVYTRQYQLITTPGLNLVYVGMNHNIPPFNDPRVRQAVSYAVDTKSIVKEVTGRGSVPAFGILPQGIAGSDPSFKGYPYDLEKARALLSEAGYPEGKGFPPIEIWTVSKSETVQKELLSYKKYLADVGIQLQPKVANNWKEFVSLINSKKVPMFYAAWYADYPDPDNFLYVLSHSKSPTNRMGYSNETVDKMLEDARHETDYMKRVELYRNIEKQVMNDASVICQHTNSYNALIQLWVKGVELGYMGPAYSPLKKVWIDKKRRARMLGK